MIILLQFFKNLIKNKFEKNITIFKFSLKIVNKISF